MKLQDSLQARGQVAPYFINIATSQKTPWPRRHNTISYEATFSMASAFGGDLTYVPNRIGIIYGTQAQFGEIGRDQSWDETGGLQDELSTQNADVQVVPFSFSPSVTAVNKSTSEGSDSSDSSDSTTSVTESGYAVTFHAHSDSTTKGAFKGGDFVAGNNIYQAVLLNKTGTRYRIIARASLGVFSNNVDYLTKPTGFEIALDWTIKFF